MKPYRLILFLLCSTIELCSFGQVSFNQRLIYGDGPFKPASLFVNLEDEQIYVHSWRVVDGWQVCSSSHSFDGTFLSSMCLGADWGWNGLAPENDGISEDELQIQCGSQIDPDTISGGFYQIYSAFGEPVRFNYFQNPWWDGDPENVSAQFVICRDWLLDATGNVCISYIGNGPSSDVTDCGVILFDANDQYQWHLEWIGPLTEQIFALTKLNDHYYLALNTYNDEWVFNAEIDIYKVNMQGEIVEVWEDPWAFNTTEILEIVSDDQSLVCTGSYSEAIDIPSDALIFKMDTLMNVEWWSIIDNQETNYRRKFEDITITTDGNYVVSGQYPYDLEEPDPINGDQMYDGWLAKFDADDGDLMWERFFRIVESTDKKHQIFDLKATPDGGVAFCGESLDYTDDWTDENPLQQGWLVKVDEYGCLVPGCQNVGVDESGIEEDAFSFGPNPLPQGQALNVFNARHLSQDARYELWSADGQLIASMAAGYANLTTFWTLQQVASGIYLLQLVEKGKVVQSEKLVVE